MIYLMFLGIAAYVGFLFYGVLSHSTSRIWPIGALLGIILWFVATIYTLSAVHK